jgi:hypothetical protein
MMIRSPLKLSLYSSEAIKIMIMKPGENLILEEIRDLKGGLETIAALLVSIGAPRLRRLALPIPDQVISSPERRLYEMLSKADPDGAHSQYNALIRLLVSYERAAECVK